MNIVLWIVQGILAFFCLSGGGFKLAKPADVAKQAPTIPEAGWRVVGVIEVLGALLVIVPWATGFMPQLTPIAALVIALENLVLSVIYARISTRMTAANPLMYSALITVLAAVVAFGRF